MLTGFHDVRFPPRLSFGSTGGPERRTDIVALGSGFEARNTPWAHGRRRFDAGVAARSLDDLHEIIAFFEARGGRLFGFRWRDWTDWRSGPPSRAPAPDDQFLGVGDGARTLFALNKRYASGGYAYDRPIAKPIADSVRVAVGGVEQAGGWTLDGGNIVFAAAPPAGAAVTAGFDFDTPARFDVDRLEFDLIGFNAGRAPSIPVIEIRI